MTTTPISFQAGQSALNPLNQRPDALGRFGQFGGKYVPETLMPALAELEAAFHQYWQETEFQQELNGLLRDYVGRPSPLYFAERMTQHYARPDGTGVQIYLKREDLNHTGAHKINNALGQVLLAKRMGKQRIIAETGAGQHGVATATVCARFGLSCVIYMGVHDMERQALNVFRMRLMGAEVRPVEAGTGTLKDATSEAIRDWVTNVETTHYILGSVAGPHPYPMVVREFHNVIGQETRSQSLEKWGGLPDILLACVGGGSNAMGLFNDFIHEPTVRMIGIEAGTGTLKDATSEAIRDWVTNVETTHYILGSVAGPHPYPMVVREFHNVIGQETRSQSFEKWGGLPDILLACVGGGSNAMGLFNDFIHEPTVRMIGIEAAGEGADSGKHAATLTRGRIGVLHGAMSYLLQDQDGQVIEPYSISAGLDYPGVGPEHSFLKDLGRAEYYSVTDQQALEALQRLSQLEGIIPALETAHAIAYLETLCPQLSGSPRLVINCSGRGDKDVQSVAKVLKMD